VYWEVCFDLCQSAGAEELPAAFALAQNHTNPFNPVTTIDFSLPETDQACLAVHNLAGERVAVLVEGLVERGEHSVGFDASNLSSGVYFYTLSSGSLVDTKKMILAK